MNGTYQEGEEHQFTMVKFICNVKHNPGSPSHLHIMLREYLKSKGITLTENNEVYI